MKIFYIFVFLFFFVRSTSILSLSQMVFFQHVTHCCLLNKSYRLLLNAENLSRFWFLMEILVIFLVDHLKTQKMCDHAFRIEHTSCIMLLINIITRRCATSQFVSDRSLFILFLTSLRKKRYVFKQLKNIHGICSMTLIKKYAMM